MEPVPNIVKAAIFWLVLIFTSVIVAVIAKRYDILAMEVFAYILFTLCIILPFGLLFTLRYENDGTP